MKSLSTPMPIRLNGRLLFASRLLYLLLFLICLGMFSTSLWYKFVQGTSGCGSIYNAAWAAQGNWCTEWFQAIADLRVTAVAFESYFVGLRVIAALPFFMLSLLLVWRYSQELRILLLAGLLLVIGISGTWFNPFWEWGGWWLEEFSPYPALHIFSPILTYLLVCGAFLFACLFPNGRFVPHWSRWLAGSWLLLSAGNIFLPETIFAMGNWPFPLHSLVPFVYVLLGIGIIIFRYRQQATAIQRQQIKWITFGMMLIAFNFLIDFAVFDLYETFTGSYPLSNGQQAVYWELGQDTLSHLSQFALGICFGFAVFRRRLWGIDPILNRTLVYGGLTLLIVAIYIGIVGGLGLLFQTQTNPLIGLVATGIIAVLFQPLRDGLQRGVNRLLYGERDDPAAVLTRLAQQMETAATTDILAHLVQTIARTLKIPHAAIWLPVSDNQFDPAAVWGTSPEHVEMMPLTYQSKMIGHLAVAPRDAGGTFNQRERDLLNTIAALTASTVRAVQLSDELRQSRQRIVTAREDERRRLRRDLHDGLGPQLASQTLGLEAIGQLMTTHPQKARDLLASLQTQAQEAIVDVRRLVYALRPPALDDLGLVAALQQSANRLETEELRFSFDLPHPLPALPAAVETAVYRITQEAMTNVVRHAQATTCIIRLDYTDNTLSVTIQDDGQGLSPKYQAGVGLNSMRERAEELNGVCMIQSLPEGGTQVQAQLPLEVNDV
ncbi:GAF domain-containing sensor histidine kinase [Candidatus Leptofilum sp.]|uniref:GAF domain-containing sensor histidine kinase n=1 Tax=Candidatus Leptofilum sp. TaxID=3241576 RepID=UPI003B5B6426